jgi:tetratricopeptide (TPR) repeat protein
MRKLIMFASCAVPMFLYSGAPAQGCPLVTVSPSAKAISKISQPLRFTANLTKPAAGATFNWQLTGAGIVSGQGTPTVTIDPSALAAETGTIKAAVDVQVAGCGPQGSSAEVQITQPTARDYYDRGMKGVLLGDRKSAIADLTRAIEMDPKMTAAYDGRATGRLVEEDFDGAIADSTKVIELDPRNARAYQARGVAKLYKKDFASAADDFSKAIEIDPKNMLPYEKRSEAKEGLNDLDGAIADVNKAMALKPDDIGLYRTRARYYKKAGKADLAAADLAKVDELIKKLPSK